MIGVFTAFLRSMPGVGLALSNPLLTVFALALLAPTTSNAAQLEEIVVTARKREESILNIPVAVTAITGETLDRYNLRTIEDISAAAPQLSVVRGSSGSGATLSLRGVGSSFTSIGIEQSVAVIVDGVYYGQGRVINEGFFDMEQVEILKGPQALFFGKNASAGVLAFASADPGDEFEAMLRVGNEFTSETPYVEGVLSGPVTDQFGVRLAVRGASMRGGYVKNIAPPQDLVTFDIATGTLTSHTSPAPETDLPQEEDLMGRLTAKLQASERLTLTLKAAGDRYRVINATWNNEMVFCPQGSAQVPLAFGLIEPCNADWKIRQNDAPRDIAAQTRWFSRHNGQLYQDYDSYAVTGTAEYVGDSFTLTSVTGYHDFVNYFLGDYDYSGFANGGTWGSERSMYDAFSTEMRLQTDLDGPVNYMIGTYYQSTQLDFDQRIIFPGALEDSSVANSAYRYLTVTKLSQTEGTTFAAFGQVLWQINEQFEATAGARYTDENKRSNFRQPYVIAPFEVSNGGPFVQGAVLAADQDFENVSPEATLSFKPNRDTTFYVAYKQGFKSGGFSGSGLYAFNTTVNDLAFDPEEAEGFEAGLKANLFDSTVRLDAVAYYYEYDDFQIDYFDSANIQFITTNAGTVKTQGIEIQADWAPNEVPGLLVRASGSYNKSRYKTFSGAPCWAGQTPAEGCTIGTDGRTSQDLTGEETALAPKWIATFDANYERPVGNSLIAGASVNLRYTSSYSTNPWDHPNYVQDDYALVDATLRIGAENERWEVALVGKNLTDKYYAAFHGDAPSSGGGTGTVAGFRADQVAAVALPRTYALQATVRY
jgi:outer membrane receptor protein involved in Fe transport